MTLYSLPAVAMAAIAFYVGAYHLFIYARRPLARQDLPFALTCLSIGAYSALCAGQYSAASPEQGVLWQRWQMLVIGLLGATLLWFAHAYLGRKPGKLPYLLGAAIMAAALVCAFDRGSLAWLDKPSIKEVHVPFLHAPVVYREMAAGPFSIALSVLGVLILAYMIWIAVQSFRRGARKKAARLIAGTVLLAAAAASDAAVNADLYDFLYVTKYAYVGLMFMMVYALSDELVAAERFQRALEDSESRLRALFEGINDAVFVHDLDGRILDCNEAAHRRLGYTRDEFVGMHTRDIDSPRFAQGFDERIRRQLEEGRCSCEGVHLRKDGSEVPVDVNTSLITYNGQQAILAVMRDITERKQAETALRESEERFRMLAENVPGVIYLCKNDRRWTMIYLNDAVKELTGYPKEDFLTDRISFADLYNPDDTEGIYADVEKALADRVPFHLTYRLKHRSGDWRWIDEAGGGVYRNGELLMLEGFLSDISARKRAEEDRKHLETQVQQAQKLESLGVLAGGIAHDFNNLLMGILGNADLALDHLSPVSPARQSIVNIETAGKRAAELCRQMLAYSGKGKFIVEAVNLNEVVQEMDHLLSISISKKAVLTYGLAGDLPAIEADPTQLRQVIMNLIINASDAIDEKSHIAGEQGLITVTTGVMDCDRSYLRETYVDEDLPEGRYAYVEVSDSGCGMSAETRGRIFDPFFTTKFTGRGLGLSVVLGIVRGHGGVLKIYSEEGRGSTLKALFPAVDTPLPSRAAEPDAGEEWGATGLVLLVDDEEVVRDVASEMLETMGFDVLTADDGDKAVELFREHGDELRCVVLDLTMPRMDGEQTLRALRGIRQDVPVIISSGYNEQELTTRFLGRGPAGFIQKPYQLRTLATVIREVFSTWRPPEHPDTSL
ncbi:MAG: PAS domain S-box protein [Candidatus Hydrogenedentes bacterium]|nr:PAS domain S-box protein [Candidatus Hydrogenedentota bacterium]